MKKLLKIFLNYCILSQNVLQYVRENVSVCFFGTRNGEVNVLPNIKSAKKRVKVTASKELQNQMFKTNLKTTLKKFEQAVASGDKAAATEAYTAAVSKLDKAVVKGAMHINNAARKKSQITVKLNSMN